MSGLYVGASIADVFLTGGVGTVTQAAGTLSVTSLLKKAAEAVKDLYGNVASNVLAEEYTKRYERGEASGLLENRDLAAATGDAIARAMLDAARSNHVGCEKNRVEALAGIASHYWQELEAPPLGDSDVANLFHGLANGSDKAHSEDRAKAEVLGHQEWVDVLAYFEEVARAAAVDIPYPEFRKKRRSWSYSLSDEVRNAVARELQLHFPEKLHEVLNEDAGKGGRVYAGLVLETLREILETTRNAASSDEVQKAAGDIRSSIKALGKEIGQLKQSSEEALAGRAQDLSEALSAIGALGAVVDREVKQLRRAGEEALVQRSKSLDQLAEISDRMSREHEAILVAIKAEGEKGKARVDDLKTELGKILVKLGESALLEPRLTRVSVDELLGEEDWAHNPWTALLARVGRNELRYYNQEIEGAGVGPEGWLWEERLEPYVKDLQHWVPVIDRVTGATVPAQIHARLRDAASAREPLRLWVVAPPGAGKTTVLYRSYFRVLERLFGAPGEVAEGSPPLREDVPIPMLVQPRYLERSQVLALDGAAGLGRVWVLTQVWLQNRLIAASPEQLEELALGLLRGLNEGSVAPFIDSFDELSRMDIHAGLATDLLARTRRFVCATREETFTDRNAAFPIRLSLTWDRETARRYLHSRLGGSPEEIEPFLAHATHPDQPEWLLNPRFLTLLVDQAERGSDSDLMAAARQGQYALLDSVYDHVNERLLRVAARRGTNEDRDRLEGALRTNLERIAASQVREGSCTRDAAEVRGDLSWDLLCGDYASDFLRVEGDPDRGGRVAFRFENFTFIDYFLARPIAERLIQTDEPLTFEHLRAAAPAPSEADSDSAPLTLDHLWSSSLLAFLSAELRERAPREGGLREVLNTRLWARLFKARLKADLPDDAPCRPNDNGAAERFQTVNLLHLIVRLLHDERDPEGRRPTDKVRASIEIEGKGLNDLYLERVDLSRLRFVACTFDRAVLEQACLEHAVFDDCTFRRTNLRRGEAAFATFDYCRFDFHTFPASRPASLDDPTAAMTSASSVADLFVPKIQCPGSNVDVETFRAFGAQTTRSRYLGAFGARFFKKQAAFLGGKYRKAERCYRSAIVEVLERTQGANRGAPIFAIDLMAGGSNERLLDVMSPVRAGPTFPTLHVLAIDRDTHQLIGVREEIGSRFEIAPKEIEGRAGLAEELQRFDRKPESAHLIVAKKALHELPPDQQQELIGECFEVLTPGGALILFADSPTQMSAEGYERLESLKGPIRSAIDEPAPDLDALRSFYIDGLALESDDPDAPALFCNLWVLLKDWANHNRHEVLRRYFSSAAEIRAWARAAGFQPEPAAPAPRRTCEEDERTPEVFYYTLIARVFNEIGVNKVCARLEAREGELSSEDWERVREDLRGEERHRLFYDFADHHLGSSDAARTALGRVLCASEEEIAWGNVHEALTAMDRSPADRAATAFRFPVHVMTFIKPEDRAHATDQTPTREA